VSAANLRISEAKMKLVAKQNKLSAEDKALLTQGNAGTLFFTVETDWQGFSCTAVFKNSAAAAAVEVSVSGSQPVPWEALAQEGELYVSLRGTGTVDSGAAICTNNVWLGHVGASLAAQLSSQALAPTSTPLSQLTARVAAIEQREADSAQGA